MGSAPTGSDLRFPFDPLTSGSVEDCCRSAGNFRCLVAVTILGMLGLLLIPDGAPEVVIVAVGRRFLREDSSESCRENNPFAAVTI